MESFPPVPPTGAAKPKNWLVENIVAGALGLFCCCGISTIPGVIGVIYATQVDSKYNAGDFTGAASAANTARTLFYVTAGLTAAGLLINIISFLFYGGLMFEELRRQGVY